MADTEGIYARHFPYLDRYVQFGLAGGRVIAVSFPDEPAADAIADHELLDRIEGYFEGVREEFSDVPVAFTVSGDERSILETTRTIPYGEDVSVAELARSTPGLDDDSEARDLVRSVLADNPVPLLVPDHRVRDGASATPPAVEQKIRQVEGL